jgi:phosphoglucosamine mutase
MYICARYMKSLGLLKKDTVVTTVMSNLGLYKALEEEGIESRQTAVGDRYVMEAMREESFSLGGEQSGHLIFLDFTTTGDGMLSALQLVSTMKATGKSLSELAAGMTTFPQKLVNVKVSDKNQVMEDPSIIALIEQVEKEMDGNGRILVRPSGTEPLVRVMAEAPTEEACDAIVDRVARVVQEKYGPKEAV